MTDDKALVLGASGFLGSHVVKALVASGRPVRILTRTSSNTAMTDHLDLDRQTGDVFDRDTLRKAMTGCSSVFYCIVDTRAWLRDPAPLYQINVEGSRRVMEVALDTGVERFVFTSSVVAVGLNPSGVASEADEFNWEDQAPPYVMTRVAAERQLLDFCRKGLPGVVCNVATTFGGHDHQPTPHGELLKLTVARQMPVHWNMKMSVVGIKDAADALLLAEQRGKVGERYIIADRMMDIAEATSKTAAFAGVRPPRLEIPMWLVTGTTWVVEKLMRVLHKDTVLTMDSIVLSRIMGDYDTSKARSELGWKPRPMEESLKEAAIWFKENP
jgi:dihydroflavonol-4-reductase